ncbi:MAG: hypothetical protein CFE31_09885 [Rhizobiales bacterium PAR1]|nr:MAG: hypothetical protein CFE31_09885 [Rhizobiales bacterium PAR1]
MVRGQTFLVLARNETYTLADLDRLMVRVRSMTSVEEVGLAVLHQGRLCLLSPQFDQSVTEALPALALSPAWESWQNPVRGLIAEAPQAESALLALMAATPWLELEPQQIASLSTHLVAGPGVDRAALSTAAGHNVTVSTLPPEASDPEVAVLLPFGGEPRVWRLLVVNITQLVLHHALGSLIERLLANGHSIELAKFAGDEDFIEDPRITILDPTQLKPGTLTWDLVLLGAEIPSVARQFRQLRARLILSERACNLYSVELPVSLVMDGAGLGLRASLQSADAYWLVPPESGALSVVVNGRLSGKASTAPSPPRLSLAERLRLYAIIQGTKAPMAVVDLVARVHARTGVLLEPSHFAQPSFCHLMGAGGTPDPLLPLAVCGMAISAFAEPTARGFCNAAYTMLLARPCEDSFHERLETPLSLDKMADIFFATARSQEFARRSGASERRIIIGALTDLKTFVQTRHEKLKAEASDPGDGGPLSMILTTLIRRVLAERRRRMAEGEVG